MALPVATAHRFRPDTFVRLERQVCKCAVAQLKPLFTKRAKPQLIDGGRVKAIHGRCICVKVVCVHAVTVMAAMQYVKPFRNFAMDSFVNGPGQVRAEAMEPAKRIVTGKDASHPTGNAHVEQPVTFRIEGSPGAKPVVLAVGVPGPGLQLAFTPMFSTPQGGVAATGTAAGRTQAGLVVGAQLPAASVNAAHTLFGGAVAPLTLVTGTAQGGRVAGVPVVRTGFSFVSTTIGFTKHGKDLSDVNFW